MVKAEGRRQKAEGRRQKAEVKGQRQRRGLSYLEVLIAAGIALTGILGAIAMFPVAILNMQKGQVVDVMASVGPLLVPGRSK